MAADLRRGAEVLIIAGDGSGIKGIITSIEGEEATVINLMRGTYKKRLEELKELKA